MGRRLRIVAALGGNALIRRGQPLSVQTQRDNLAAAALALAPLAREHWLVVTHGNGPQVGLLALQAAAYAAQELAARADDAAHDAAAPAVAATPLDVLGAESEGMVGYLIEQALANAAPEQRFATLLTQVEVDAADPAFAAPTKPIGPLYTDAQLARLGRPPGWRFARDGASWRRVVASPRPVRVLEIGAIRLLLDAGATVICGGGGGIPVLRSALGHAGVEAVIDKDHASGLLARELHADLLLLLTDVQGVAVDFGRPGEHWLHAETPQSLALLELPAGSMGPKVQAAIDFVHATGQRAAIGSLGAAQALVSGTAGTQVTADRHVEPVERASQWRRVIEP